MEATPSRMFTVLQDCGAHTVVLPELSESLGLGWSSGANSSLQRSMRRLMMFGLARWTDGFEVLTMVPALSERRLARMSPGLVRAHDRMLRVAEGQAA